MQSASWLTIQYYIHCKDPLPMDVDFMLSDSIEVSVNFLDPDPIKCLKQAVRPKLEMMKTLEQAAIAVDEMFNSAYQAPGTLIEFLSLFYSIHV
jgi:regulator of nonsense transcripts 2